MLSVEEANDSGLIDQFNQYLASGGTLSHLNGISQRSLDTTQAIAYHKYQSGLYDEALKYFQYLCLHHHWKSDYFLSMAACQQMLGFYYQAIETYLHAARLGPKNPMPLIYICECYIFMGDLPKARKALIEALEKDDEKNTDLKELKRIELLLLQSENQEVTL
ncbi:SycD/LcrH family type III secretion system chaperone [Candidatus Sororendozoicomonas aggregata]|uniref:SycD/LcrH family type III secretion system chaperone n=1 Tax=Candidatus Sororendozoicomonas aggregata TaxID=3073239 RepID=UPI002ED5DFCA